jgi:hypothetical protein
MPLNYSCSALPVEHYSKGVIMHDEQTNPTGTHENSARTHAAAAQRTTERDEVYDASVDSFPASDPPSWMGMRVGGPSAERAESAREPSSAIAERPPPAGASVDRRGPSSLASRWTDVHVSHMEARTEIADGRTDRTALRAVVQLGTLAPADVRVTVWQPGAHADAVHENPVRLWSTQSYRNGGFVFEAITNASGIANSGDLLVSVEPAPAKRGGATLDPVVTQFARNDIPAEVTRCNERILN